MALDGPDNIDTIYRLDQHTILRMHTCRLLARNTSLSKTLGLYRVHESFRPIGLQPGNITGYNDHLLFVIKP